MFGRALHLGSDGEGLTRLGPAATRLIGEEATLERVRAALGGDFVCLAFAGHSTRNERGEVGWRMHDGVLWLSEIGDALADRPAGQTLLLIVDSCYAAALANHLRGAATVVLIAACQAEQMVVELAESHFLAQLAARWPEATSLAELEAGLRADAPDVELPRVWSNRPGPLAERVLPRPRETGS